MAPTRPALLALSLLLGMWACDEPTDPGLTDACRLAETTGDCPVCADGDVTCSLDGVEVTRLSCGGCQAEAALIEALCDAGSTVTEEEIFADGVCVPAS